MRGQRKKLIQVARIQARGLLYIPKPDQDHALAIEYDEAAAAFGLQPEADSAAPPSDKCYLWPCNQVTFAIWQRLQTQWRFAPNGRCLGLDYSAVSDYLCHIRRVPAQERADLFHTLQAMEFEALDVYASNP